MSSLWIPPDSSVAKARKRAELRAKCDHHWHERNIDVEERGSGLPRPRAVFVACCRCPSVAIIEQSPACGVGPHVTGEIRSGSIGDRQSTCFRCRKQYAYEDGHSCLDVSS